MRRLLSSTLCVALCLAIGAWPASAQTPPPVAAVLEEHLYGGRLEAGDKALRALLASEPGNAEARFALGGVLVMRAVESFGQSMYRHGLQLPRNVFLPLFGLPLAYNASPEPITYDGFRAILARLVQDLDAAEAELARVGDAPVKLTVDIARIRLDLDANGVADERERLSMVIQALAQAARRRGIRTPAGDSFPVGFDLADVYWLRGYANLLAVSAEFFLTYDFRTTFDATFHVFFPRAGLPFGRLFAEPTTPGRGGDMGSILDAVAFIHLVRWEVAEPLRLISVHTRLKNAVALSRKTWGAVRAKPTTTTSGCQRLGRRACSTCR